MAMTKVHGGPDCHPGRDWARLVLKMISADSAQPPGEVGAGGCRPSAGELLPWAAGNIHAPLAWHVLEKAWAARHTLQQATYYLGQLRLRQVY